ncbi:MAG: hypothetical protein CVV47_16940, partial [Spirochaetae bacterium HGW-Spirochaetae-3]
MKIGARLSLGFAVIVVFLLAMTLYASTIIRSTTNNMSTVVQEFLPAIDFLEQADRDFFQLIEAERTQLLLGDAGEQNNRWDDAWKENLDQARSRMASYAELATTDEEKRLYVEYLANHETWFALAERVIAGAKDPSPVAASRAKALALGEASTAFDAMRESINQLEELVMKNADGIKADTLKFASFAITTSLVLAAIAIALTLGLSVLITRGITRPLRECVRISDALAEGDISIKVDARWTRSRDETGDLARAMDKTVAKLGEVIRKVQETIDIVSENSGELLTAAQQMATGIAGIADSSQQLSQGATEQAASAEEVS